MLKNYNDNDKKIAIKLKKILKNNYKPVENVDGTNLNTNQTDNQADFLALRIIDNLIRFNQSFRLSQVPIKANMSKYNKKGSGVKFVGGVFTHEYIANNFKTSKGKPIPTKDEPTKAYKEYNGKYYAIAHYNFIKKKEAEAEAAKIADEEAEAEAAKIADEVAEADKIAKKVYNSAKAVEFNEKRLKKNFLVGLKKNKDEEIQKVAKADEYNNKRLKNNFLDGLKKNKDELEVKKVKELEYKLNQFDSDNKFPSSFEALLSAYSLIQNIDRNYRDLRAIFNNISVPVFNDLNDVLYESNELIEKSVKTFKVGNSPWTKKSISYNMDDYLSKLNKIFSNFNNIYNDFQQRKQTFNTNIKTGSGFGYLSKIRNI